MRSRFRASVVPAALAVVALALTGCAANEQGDVESDLAGTLDGAGSSAQGAAQDAWVAGFQRQNGSVTVNYDPAGSGAGREQFLVGAVGYAGSDAALSTDELDGELARCAPDAGAIDLPVYLSPIVLAFHVEGVDELALDASVTARIFSGELTRWNDPAIAALNPGESLPDAAITAVHRSDDSGTTENFTDYLADAAGDDWPWPADDVFPVAGEAAQGNSGVAAVIRDGRNVIGYLDASRAVGLAVADLIVGDEPVTPTAEAAAAAVDQSPVEEGRAEDDLVVDLARDTTEAGVYPLVLVSYAIACREYLDPNEGELVRSYLEWVGSEAGQEAAARDAGSAPISPDLRERVLQAVSGIS
jgi:phosphate transport system substrate-binding protein